jgi:hypothetical protein
VKAVTVAPGTAGSVRLEDVPEPDPRWGRCWSKRWPPGSAAPTPRSPAAPTGGRRQAEIEVAKAKVGYPDTALFILADVTVVTEAGDRPSARGGRAVVLEPWMLRDEHLEPVAYEYIIPS